MNYILEAFKMIYGKNKPADSFRLIPAAITVGLTYGAIIAIVLVLIASLAHADSYGCIVDSYYGKTCWDNRVIKHYRRLCRHYRCVWL